MNQTFTFEFTTDQVNVILAGLQELPFKMTHTLIQNILEQHQKQQEKAE